jgi:hypothetical protein
MSLKNDKEYIIEYTTIGNAVKITAVDPESGIEVSTIAPSLMSRRLMADAAIRKLEYKIRKIQAKDVL